MVRKPNARSQSAEGPRQRRRDQQRQAILKAAAQLFRERGFADTGMRDIATAADLSAANLYHYFAGKNELLVYCQERALDRMLGAVAAARKASASPVEQLRFVLDAHTRTLLDDIEGATAHLQIESLPPAMREAIVKKRDRYERGIRKIIDEGIRRGEFVDMEAPVIARAMLGAMNWTVTWFRPDGPAPAGDVADALSRFLVRGIASRTPAVRREFKVVATKAGKARS
jgi:AcrR family transcriptional regulator